MLQFANKASAYLASAITAAATSVAVQTGGGANFPALVAGLILTLKIEEPSTGVYEIVYATALTTDTFTLARAQEGSTAQAFQPTAIVSLVATKRLFEGLMRRKNRIINGCFRLWDHGTSFANPANGTLLANNWKVASVGPAGTFAISRVASTVGDWERDNAPKYFLRWNQTVVGTPTAAAIEQRIEDVRQFAGDNITISFLAKAASGTPTVFMIISQVFGTGGSPSATVTSAAMTKVISTALAEYEITFAVPSIAGKTLGSNGDDYLSVQIGFDGTTLFDIQLGNIQAGKTSLAMDFEYRSEAEERKLAARYFFKTFDNDTAPAQNAGTSGALAYVVQAAGVNQAGLGVRYPAAMRVSPTLTFYNPSAANALWRNTTDPADSGAVATSFGNNRGVLLRNPQVAGDGVGEVIAVHMTADANL